MEDTSSLASPSGVEETEMGNGVTIDISTSAHILHLLLDPRPAFYSGCHLVRLLFYDDVIII